MIRLLRPDDELYEEDELSFNSEHECACCQEVLLYTEEIFLLEVVEAAQDGGEVLLAPLQADDGDYQYPPCFVHFDCWEECISIIDEATADTPPYEALDGILFCSRCSSTIGSFEPFVSSTFGELRVSRRLPGGDATARLERLEPQKPVCLACMVHVIEEYLSDWEDLLDDLPVPRAEEEEDE